MATSTESAPVKVILERNVIQKTYAEAVVLRGFNAPLAAPLLRAAPFGTPVGRLFAGLVALLLVVLAGRFVLRVACVVVATVLVGAAFLLSGSPSL